MNEDRSRRQPVSAAIDETIVRTVVHGFYAKIRNDQELGPIFERVVHGNWDEHLAKMCDFWSSVMLMTGRYKGNPMIAHMRLKTVRPAHFERWLSLFRETVRELCDADVASLFIGKAENIARSLQLGMFYRTGGEAPLNDQAGHPHRP